MASVKGDSFYDTLESRDPEIRERELFERLRAHLAHARSHAPGCAELLADIDPSAVTDRAALASLPVTRKSELSSRQGRSPPFGGLAAVNRDDLRKIFASPGPIYEPESARPNYWRMARALHAAGFRPGHLVHNSYSYHLTPAGSMLETGAFAIGCAVVPGGVGQTELQVEAIVHLRPDGYVGTPSFLKILLDKAAESGRDVSSLSRASVSGEALPASLRKEFDERQVSVLQTYATADLGLIAYESAACEGLILDEEIIVEIVRPGSGDPVPDGDVGEVVVTVLNPDYPLIRFATGDLSAFMEGASPCGRTNRRIRGWMGRADQTTKVRGMFVRPEQVNAVAARHPEISAWRVVVSSADHQDVMTFRCVCSSTDESLKAAIEQTIRDLCKVKSAVEFVDPGALRNDGKVIDDTRSFE